ncbi:class I SAM-dependent methyltransferase [Streptomyces sp. NBC_01766]|uniref:class I SAM-dependent methyltransferase n=1 Tax=Streptomyces sp. NBC_01766 TaxID=2975936 RepID=UPI002DD9AA30|nr:class I SAM-dependent methyltransferase [Streptomyces sp. NBC_01766]WSC19246.1 class I SAM-dependent methyltransferase [Streptomyces sp. NBC_01766]
MTQSAGHADVRVPGGHMSPGLEVFSRGWPDQAPDTVCGWGSSEPHTQLVRKELVNILETYEVTTLNDAGCGDLAWMSTLDLGGVDYTGYDVHERDSWPELRRRGFRLEVVDITVDEPRPADLLICRDVFIHLPNDMILAALERFRKSCRLLLTTSYTSDPGLERGEFTNSDRMEAPSLLHAKLDLALPPFGLGTPLERIPEDSPNKYLGLWDMTAAPAAGAIR